MKVIKLDTPYNLSAIPRVAPCFGDSLQLTVKNEFSGIIQTDTLTDWQPINGRLSFVVPSNTDFLAGNKYEISIKNLTSNEIIYLGKMIVVKEDTDIQNYTPSKQITQRFK